MDKNGKNMPANNKQEKQNNKHSFFKQLLNDNKINFKWPLKIFIITFMLALIFSVGSELILTSASIAIAIIIIVVLLIVSVLFDMLGVAVAASSIEPFVAMASKKVRSSKQAIKLVQNADKVSSFASDVVGDICGILSGAVGAALVIRIYAVTGDLKSVLIASLISAIIAALTVFGKAVGKVVAINYPNKIVFFASKIISFFKLKK